MRSTIWISSVLALLVALSTFYATPALAQSGTQSTSESRMPKQTERNKPVEEKPPEHSPTTPLCTETDCNSLYFYAGGATKQATDTVAGASDAYTKGRADVKATGNFSYDIYSGAISKIADYGVAVRDGVAGSSAANAVAPTSILVGSSGGVDNKADNDRAAPNEISDAPGTVAASTSSATTSAVSNGTGDGEDNNEEVVRGGASYSNAADDADEGESASFELAGFETGTSLLELSPIALLTAVSPLILVRSWV